MVEFLRKFENSGIIIARVNWIVSQNLSIYTCLLYFFTVLEVRFDVDIFKLVLSPFMEKCAETWTTIDQDIL